MADVWNPDQYGKFRAERAAPFLDLLARRRKRRAYEAELDHDMEEMFPRPAGAVLAAVPARPRSLRRLAVALRAVFHRLAGRG